MDCAAANGHYDLVRELLHIDPNLLIKLTSLPRIRRLETVWDDEFDNFNDVAKCRSHVARKLLHECETGKGYNSLIRAGYGGWLLYTAAAAGDLVFVKELLERESLLVFGEGEYGITDMFYAAARSRNGEVFRLLFDCSVAPKGQQGEVPPVFRWEMMNRAVHAAARGGSAAVLEELLGDGSDVLAFRDAQGSTVLHTAAGRGQVQIVKKLISSYDGIIDSVDDRGNTALNVAAYRGHLAVMEVLISASPSSALLTNNYGDTFLQMAIAGFRTPTFRRLDRQIELMKEVVGGKLVKIEEIINVRNNDGRTALHMAVVESIQSEVVELLLSVCCIDLNVRDGEGNTPLDLLRQRPQTASSQILIKRLVAAGGVSGCEDRTVRNAHLRMRGIGGSPGTSFRIPDVEMVLYTGLEDTCRSSSECGYSGEARDEVSASPAVATPYSGSFKLKKSSSMTSATSRLKILLRWPRRRGCSANAATPDLIDSFSSEYSKSESIPLRQQFSRQAFPPSNKRILSLQGNLPSPTSKKKFASGSTPINARQVLPKSNLGSPCSALSESSWSSPSPASIDQSKLVNLECVSAGPSSSTQSPNVEKMKMKRRHGSFNLGLMNNYFCFGAQGLAVENSIRVQGQRLRNQHSLVDAV